MTREEAIAAEIYRYTQAAADGDNHLAHIRFAALTRLRGSVYPFDTVTEEFEDAGNRMFEAA